MAVVEVEWVDSHQHGGWADPDDYLNRIKNAGLYCKSTGYLFHEDDTRIALVMNQGLSGNICEAIQIPKVAVQRVTLLRGAQAEEEK